MEWVYDDGGRSRYFSASSVCDCVTRSVAIATGLDYKEVYNRIRLIIGYSPRNGIKRKDVKKVLDTFGGKWHSCMSIGSGCKVHLKDGQIPMDKIIVCSVSKHLTCVRNGIIRDTFDPSRDGSRCVYGYWEF